MKSAVSTAVRQLRVQRLNTVSLHVEDLMTAGS